MGSNQQELLAGILEHRIQGGTTDDQPPAGAGALALRHYRRIAVEHPYLGRVDSQLVGHDLGEGGFVTLPMGRYPGINRHLAGGVDDHPGVFGPVCPGRAR